jgi:hypothetical protein
MAAAIVAAFVVSQILAVLVHGFVLAADYGPYYGTLLRSQAGPAPQMLLLPVAHLSFIAALVWVFSRVEFRGGVAEQGIKVGLLGWLIGQAPLWLLWYAEQPWPGTLVLKQLSLELASSIVIGLTVAAISINPNLKTSRS